MACIVRVMVLIVLIAVMAGTAWRGRVAAAGGWVIPVSVRGWIILVAGRVPGRVVVRVAGADVLVVPGRRAAGVGLAGGLAFVIRRNSVDK